MSRFLRYTVERKLRGEEGQIKEFLLGQEVFDRGADYDPRTDPIVRVEARRLRQRLAEYYDGPGQRDALRITFPKGSYAPVVESAASPTVRRQVPWRWAAAVVAGLLGLWVVYRMGVPRAAELAVVPARWVWNASNDMEAGDDAMAEAITAELVKRGRLRVIGWPVVARLQGGGARDTRVLGRELGVAEVAVVLIRREAGQFRVTLFRMDTVSGQKRFVQDFFADSLAELAAREQVAVKIATALAGSNR